MDELRAAVPADAPVLERPLGTLSAEEFVGFLARFHLDHRVVAMLPDDKRYARRVDEAGGVRRALDGLIESPAGIDAIATRVVEKLRSVAGPEPTPG